MWENPWFIVFIAVVGIWELIWKGIALWRSGRNRHKVWFVFILIVNSVGILPLIYLIWFDKKDSKGVKKVKKKR